MNKTENHCKWLKERWFLCISCILFILSCINFKVQHALYTVLCTIFYVQALVLTLTPKGNKITTSYQCSCSRSSLALVWIRLISSIYTHRRSLLPCWPTSPYGRLAIPRCDVLLVTGSLQPISVPVLWAIWARAATREYSACFIRVLPVAGRGRAGRERRSACFIRPNHLNGCWVSACFIRDS